MAKRRPAQPPAGFATPAKARAAIKHICDLAEIQVAVFERKFRMPFPHLRKGVADARRGLNELAKELKGRRG